MALISRGLVAPSLGIQGVCPVPVQLCQTETVRIDLMACCGPKTIEPCIAQGSAKTFQFTDAADVDYSTATELTFDVWANGIGGDNILSKSLSAATMTTPSTNVMQVVITSSESAGLTPGSHHCEVWATFSGLQRQCVGLGRFKVIDTRKHD